MKRNLALFIGVLAVTAYNRDRIPMLLTILGYGSAMVFGLLFGAGICLLTGKKYKRVFKDDLNSGKLLKALLNIKHSRSTQPLTYLGQKRQQVTFSRNIDATIEEFISLLMRDFVLAWMKPLISDAEFITDSLRDDIWVVFGNLKERLVKIDELKLITHDVPEYLCQHYQRIRQASNSMNNKDRKPVILLRPYLVSEERELEFLRKVSELIIVLLAPKSYAQSAPMKHLFRELIACSVLYPAINQLCDPDFINMKLLSYLQHHRETLEQHKQTYTYAATYESFIKMIHECENIDQLKPVLNNIMIEIMQATAINSLKKSKGIDVEKEFISMRHGKGDLLQARNLKRYINQLHFAKAACEKRIKVLSQATSPLSTEDTPDVTVADEQIHSHEMVLPYDKLVESDFARCFFLKYLLKEDSRFLLEFYVAVEELKSCMKMKQHELGSEIYQTYIPQISNVIKLDRSILKGMESFLMGNKGPETFVQAQDLVYKFLEERFYPSFIVSDMYRKMLVEAERVGVDFETEINFAAEDNNEDNDEALEVDNNLPTPNIPLSDHYSFAKNKLGQLNEKLCNKTQALKAVQNLPLVDSKFQVTGILEKEIEQMKSEINILTSHIEKTDLWTENLGKWTVDVHSVELVEEREKTVPYFLLVVRVDECDDLINEDDDEDKEIEDDGESKGWLVKRKLSDFIELSQKLAQIGNWLKTIELPKESKIKFKGSDKAYLDGAINTLNSFMESILQDEKLNKSELLYTFLSPSPDYLKKNVLITKKPKSFFLNLFKSNSGSSQEEGSDDDELLFFDDIDSSFKDDRIAEPLYTLIGEIFDMRGVSMLLRRTLITFVQITFGRTISRQIRDTVSWVVSESMIIYYIHLLRDAIWTDGMLNIQKLSRSDERKLETRNQAQTQLLTSIPDVFSSLFGQQSSKKGARKVFESLQDLRLNKQLFYELFELLVIEIFPELKTTEKVLQ